MMENKYKLYRIEGIYVPRGEYTRYDAENGYTLIYTDKAADFGDAQFEVTDEAALIGDDARWLYECKQEIAVNSFMDFSHKFVSALLDNFERELAIEKERNAGYDGKETKWEKKRKRKKMFPLFKK